LDAKHIGSNRGYQAQPAPYAYAEAYNSYQAQRVYQQPSYNNRYDNGYANQSYSRTNNGYSRQAYARGYNQNQHQNVDRDDDRDDHRQQSGYQNGFRNR
jgi:hypothetical protein